MAEIYVPWCGLFSLSLSSPLKQYGQKSVYYIVLFIWPNRQSDEFSTATNTNVEDLLQMYFVLCVLVYCFWVNDRREQKYSREVCKFKQWFLSRMWLWINIYIHIYTTHTRKTETNSSWGLRGSQEVFRITLATWIRLIAFRRNNRKAVKKLEYIYLRTVRNL